MAAAAVAAMAALRCETAVVSLAPLTSPFVHRVAEAARALMAVSFRGDAKGSLAG